MSTNAQIFISIIASIIITVVGLLIYNYALTPKNLQDNIDAINNYLRHLIVGYTY